MIIFYKENGIQDIDYEIKTKIKALYVSVYIQRTIELFEAKHGTNEAGISIFFLQMKTNLLEILTNQPDIVDVNGKVLDKLMTHGDEDIASLTRFYTVLKEAQRWQTHAKWEKLAFYVTSMAVGEGIWYCPGGAAKIETLRRKHLFSIVEKMDNKYNKVMRRRKTLMKPMMSTISPMISSKTSAIDGILLNTGVGKLSTINPIMNHRNSVSHLIPTASVPIDPCTNNTHAPNDEISLSERSFDGTILFSPPTEISKSDDDGISSLNLIIESADPLAVLAMIAAEYDTLEHSKFDIPLDNLAEVAHQTIVEEGIGLNGRKRKLTSMTKNTMGCNTSLLYPYLPQPQDYTALLEERMSAISSSIRDKDIDERNEPLV